MELTHVKQWNRLWVGAMGSLQRSQVVMNVKTLNGPMVGALSPTIIVAEDGRDGERGLGGGEEGEWRANGWASESPVALVAEIAPPVALIAPGEAHRAEGTAL
ncbi:hypothetical protein VM1G_11292 [Cytospora mali]|uniref:Uncharacterized protein n=1 Tax=Cytospora mali TaxID=578113 RepID=A0A194VKJ0_CYTMA|nr:hypothetical protein VM1G_11292 [Valsa mali]